MRHHLIGIASVIIAGVIIASPAHAGSEGGDRFETLGSRSRSAAAEIFSGVEHQEGEYGTGRTIRTSKAVGGVRASVGKVQLSASLHYLRVDAPGNVIAGGGGLLGLPIIVDPSRPATRNRRTGLGDLWLGAAYTLPLPGIDLSLQGEMKVPTASQRKQLGTGKLDYAVGAELAKSIGPLIPFVGVAYTMPGDPAAYDLRNSVSARTGIAARLGARVRGQLAYHYAQSVSRIVPDEQSITSGINAGLSDRVSLGLFGSAGLEDGAPDFGAGLQLGVRLF